MQHSRRLLFSSQTYACYLLFVALLTIPLAAAPARRVDGRFIATAYAQSGVTAAGVHTQNHIVAADPTILPAGTVIKIRHAGRYSGEYVVADTGGKIVGRHLDIYVPSIRDCKKFGRRHVRVRVVSLGEGTHADTKAAVEVVKQDVQKDMSKGVVGNAANEADWKKQGAAVATAIGATTASTPATSNPATASNTPSPSTASASASSETADDQP